MSDAQLFLQPQTYNCHFCNWIDMVRLVTIRHKCTLVFVLHACCLSAFSQICISKQILVNCATEFRENPSSGSRVVPCRRTHMMTSTVTIFKYADAPKNCLVAFIPYLRQTPGQQSLCQPRCDSHSHAEHRLIMYVSIINDLSSANVFVISLPINKTRAKFRTHLIRSSCSLYERF